MSEDTNIEASSVALAARDIAGYIITSVKTACNVTVEYGRGHGGCVCVINSGPRSARDRRVFFK